MKVHLNLNDIIIIKISDGKESSYANEIPAKNSHKTSSRKSFKSVWTILSNEARKFFFILK